MHFGLCGQSHLPGKDIGSMPRHIAVRAFPSFLLLDVHREVEMRHTSSCECYTTGQFCHILNVCRAHDPCAVERHILENHIQIHVLLLVCAHKIVVMVAGDCQDRLAIQLSVVKSIKEM